MGGSASRDIAVADGIQIIRLGRGFKQKIVLPSGVQRATFMRAGNTYSIVLPDTLKYANIDWGVDIGLNAVRLPLGLEELVWHPHLA